MFPLQLRYFLPAGMKENQESRGRDCKSGNGFLFTGNKILNCIFISAVINIKKFFLKPCETGKGARGMLESSAEFVLPFLN